MNTTVSGFHSDQGVSCFVLAGGEGARLRPLTFAEPKPLLPFGAVHRLLDLTLCNIRNSGLSCAWVLSQYRHEDLGRHLADHWRPQGGSTLFLDRAPACGTRYRGTADAVAQSLDFLSLGPRETDPVLVLSADHVYRMDYREILRHHAESGAGATVGAIPVPLAEARQLGVISADDGGRIRLFEEKPEAPAPVPGAKSLALANMGIYVFNRWILRRVLTELRDKFAALDFGRHVLPWMAARGMAGVFEAGRQSSPAYWKDVGTLDAYHQAHMDLLDGHLGFDTFDQSWPVPALEPRVMIRGPRRRAGDTGQSVVAASATLGDVFLERSVVGSRAVIEDGATVQNTVVLPGAHVGPRARLRNVIVAREGVVASGDQIGFDPESDSVRFGLTRSGIAVVGPDERRETTWPVMSSPTQREARLTAG